MTSYISHLECTICGKSYPHEQLIGISPCCEKVLFARYDLDKLGREVDRDMLVSRPDTMWRYSELLPVDDPGSIVSLGEGGTPLIKSVNLAKNLGMRNLYIKDEGLNPTGTFKARGISAAVSKAVELGVNGFTMPSAGNAAGAAAAYGARAGMETKVFMPQDAPDANKKETLVAGSELNLVEGLINDAGREAVAVAKEMGFFDLSTLKEPYRAEGKKSMGLEVVQQLGWKMPDAMIYPTGGGTGIIGMYKGFNFNAGADTSEMWENATTKADGLRVPHPFADYLILEAIRATGGTALAVSDQEMIAAMYEMATAEGIFPAPEGAATLVGLKKLLDQKFLDPDESVVLFNTGSGYKYLDLISGPQGK